MSAKRSRLWVAGPQKLDQLQRLVTALRAGQAAPPDVAHWIAPAVQAYIDQGGDLMKHLDLRPRRGGRYEMPRMRGAMHLRDRLLVVLVGETIGSSLGDRVKRVANYLQGRGADPMPLAPGFAARILARLRELRVAIPDEERVAQICRSVTKSRFRTIDTNPTPRKDGGL